MPFPAITRRSGLASARSFLLWPLLAGFWPAPATTQDGELAAAADASTIVARRMPSTEGALFLILPVGAQGIAMGRAMTALPSQESAFWNPAGLAHVRDRRVFLYRGDQLAGSPLRRSPVSHGWRHLEICQSAGRLPAGAAGRGVRARRCRNQSTSHAGSETTPA